MGLKTEKTERERKPKKWRYRLLRDVEQGRKKRNLDPEGTKKSGTKLMNRDTQIKVNEIINTIQELKKDGI